MSINKLTSAIAGHRRRWGTYILTGNGVIAWYANINPDSPLIAWLSGNVGYAGMIVAGVIGFIMAALIDEDAPQEDTAEQVFGTNVIHKDNPLIDEDALSELR